ncbi:sarcoplasmic reticulum histidine-rich calcium-binding protein-like [Oryza brachyantha]|uniref:Uncharacterized protein n=1 Tax=Oryza brachyantha TaxID=4533 RepID=J3LBG5_ORYBR|nr:sarcoplasmic reticulum histidine-rich calcium-binding protein-like [Oryza brachyantha]
MARLALLLLLPLLLALCRGEPTQALAVLPDADAAAGEEVLSRLQSHVLPAGSSGKVSPADDADQGQLLEKQLVAAEVPVEIEPATHGEERGEEELALPVAEPDPDRSREDAAAVAAEDQLVQMPTTAIHGHDDDVDEDEKSEKGISKRIHHHHHHHDKDDDDEKSEKGIGKRIHHHHHHKDDDDDDDEKSEKGIGKRIHHHHHDKDDDDDDELEEMARRWVRKALTKGARATMHHHGGRFHHHHHRAEEEEEEEKGGVMRWVKDFVNRF